jgi:hypothetical protein
MLDSMVTVFIRYHLPVLLVTILCHQLLVPILLARPEFGLFLLAAVVPVSVL